MRQQSRKQRHWQAHINALRQSGLSRSEYCRQHKLSYHALTYWCRKLSQPNSSGTTLVPVTVQRNIHQNPVQDDRSSLKITLPGKIAIEVGDNFSPATLTKLLTILENR